MKLINMLKNKNTHIIIFLTVLIFVLFSFVFIVNVKSDCYDAARNYSATRDGRMVINQEKYNNYTNNTTGFCRFFYKNTDTTEEKTESATTNTPYYTVQERQQENIKPENMLTNTTTTTTTTEFTIPTPSWALSEYTLSSSTQYVDDTAYLSLCEKELIKNYPPQKPSHFVQVKLEDLIFKIPYADKEIGTNIKIRPYKNAKTLVKIEFGNWLYIAEGMPNDNSALYNCLPEPQYEYTLSVMPEEWLESAPIFSLESTQEIINGKRITIVRDGGLYDTTHMFYLYNGYIYILRAHLGGTQEMREIISQIEPIK